MDWRDAAIVIGCLTALVYAGWTISKQLGRIIELLGEIAQNLRR